MTGIFRTVAALGVAAVTLAGVSAGIAAASPAAHAAGPPPFLAWRFIYRGTDKAQFDTVTAVNQRDAWVAGDYSKNTTALIWHWNGTSWHSVPVPESRGFMPWYSDESSAGDVWFVGFQNFATGQTVRAIRWTSHGWRNQPMPGAQGFMSLRVLAWNDAWLANSLSCPPDSPPAQKCSSLLWHWNGSSWRQYALPVGITALSGSSATNVWVSGYRGDGGKLNELRLHFYAYRWTGSAWHAVSMPHPVSVGCLPELDTTSPHDVWMSTCGERGKKSGLVLHWNGRAWQRLWNLGGEAPIIDGKLGVWLGPTMRWTPDGIGFASLPVQNASMSFPWVTTVPGTTTLLAVGETWTNSNHQRTYVAIVGGPFGKFRTPAAYNATSLASRAPGTGASGRCRSAWPEPESRPAGSWPSTGRPAAGPAAASGSA